MMHFFTVSQPGRVFVCVRACVCYNKAGELLGAAAY